jgi:iron(III) transport system permease protein
VLYAWILVFVQSFSELSVSVLLRNVGTDVMSTAILDMWDGSARMPVATAMGAVVFLLITFLIVLAQKLTGRSLLESSN